MHPSHQRQPCACHRCLKFEWPMHAKAGQSDKEVIEKTFGCYRCPSPLLPSTPLSQKVEEESKIETLRCMGFRAKACGEFRRKVLKEDEKVGDQHIDYLMLAWNILAPILERQKKKALMLAWKILAPILERQKKKALRVWADTKLLCVATHRFQEPLGELLRELFSLHGLGHGMRDLRVAPSMPRKSESCAEKTAGPRELLQERPFHSKTFFPSAGGGHFFCER